MNDFSYPFQALNSMQSSKSNTKSVWGQRTKQTLVQNKMARAVSSIIHFGLKKTRIPIWLIQLRPPPGSRDSAFLNLRIIFLVFFKQLRRNNPDWLTVDWLLHKTLRDVYTARRDTHRCLHSVSIDSPGVSSSTSLILKSAQRLLHSSAVNGPLLNTKHWTQSLFWEHFPAQLWKKTKKNPSRKATGYLI